MAPDTATVTTLPYDGEHGINRIKSELLAAQAFFATGREQFICLCADAAAPENKHYLVTDRPEANLVIGGYSEVKYRAATNYCYGRDAILEALQTRVASAEAGQLSRRSTPSASAQKRSTKDHC